MAANKDKSSPQSQPKEPGRFAYEGLERILVLPWNERYTSEHVRYIADCVAAAASALRRAAA